MRKAKIVQIAKVANYCRSNAETRTASAELRDAGEGFCGGVEWCGRGSFGAMWIIIAIAHAVDGSLQLALARFEIYCGAENDDNNNGAL